MSDNPIIDEIRRIREDILAEHGGSIKKLVTAAQRRTEEARLAGRKIISSPPRRPKGWKAPKKAG